MSSQIMIENPLVEFINIKCNVCVSKRIMEEN